MTGAESKMSEHLSTGQVTGWSNRLVHSESVQVWFVRLRLVQCTSRRLITDKAGGVLNRESTILDLRGVME